jgi:hypothetical protein
MRLFAPVDSASGSTPRMNANEVIRIGRETDLAADTKRGLDDALRPALFPFGESSDRVLAASPTS